MGDQAVEVTDAVAIRVAEGARIDLVEDALSPEGAPSLDQADSPIGGRSRARDTGSFYGQGTAPIAGSAPLGPMAPMTGML